MTLQRKSTGEQAVQNVRRTGSNPNWRQDRENATKSLSALCALAAEIQDGWDTIVTNPEDDEVKPLVEAIRKANEHNDAEPIVMTWAMRTGYVDHAAAILKKTGDFWLTLKAAGIMATYEAAGVENPSWIKGDVTPLYNGLTPQKKEEVKQAVREALAYKPSAKTDTSNLASDDPVRIMAEMDRAREPEDPGERFAHWASGIQAEEPTAIQNGGTPPKRTLGGGKGTTSPAPTKRTLGGGKGTTTTPTDQHPLHALLATAKKPAAKNLVKSLEGGKPPESVAKTAVVLGVITQEQASEALANAKK